MRSRRILAIKAVATRIGRSRRDPAWIDVALACGCIASLLGELSHCPFDHLLCELSFQGLACCGGNPDGMAAQRVREQTIPILSDGNEAVGGIGRWEFCCPPDATVGLRADEVLIRTLAVRPIEDDCTRAVGKGDRLIFSSPLSLARTAICFTWRIPGFPGSTNDCEHLVRYR
jgi:hypothetical protein